MAVSVTGPRAVNELGGPVIPGNYAYTGRKNNLNSNVEQSSMFYISAQAKYTHFQKRL